MDTIFTVLAPSNVGDAYGLLKTALRRSELARALESELRRVVDQSVEAKHQKIQICDEKHRPQPRGGGPSGKAHGHGFGDGRVAHACCATAVGTPGALPRNCATTA